MIKALTQCCRMGSRVTSKTITSRQDFVHMQQNFKRVSKILNDLKCGLGKQEDVEKLLLNSTIESCSILLAQSGVAHRKAEM